MAFGVFGGVIGAAVAVGPVVGGVITSGIGWEWIFFVNVPIGIGAVFVTLTQVAESRDPNARGVDWVGLVTFSGVAVPARAARSCRATKRAGARPRSSRCWSPAAALLIVFRDRRAAARSARCSTSRCSAARRSRARASSRSRSRPRCFAMFLYLTLYIQDVLGYSPLQAGLRFLPITLLSFVVAPIAGKLSVRVPVRLLLGSGLLLVERRPAGDDGRRRRARAGRS